MKFLNAYEILVESIKNHALEIGPLRVLEVGGRDVKIYNKFKNRVNIEQYVILDIAISEHGVEDIENVESDICLSPKKSHLNCFDVVFSINVFEHLKEPWKAAENCVNMSKPGGLNIHKTCFAWRYHPVPSDYFRFTHEGLSSLFARTGVMEEIVCGYDIGVRRKNKEGKLLNGSDKLPRDEFGGWLENWKIIYVGKKEAKHE